MAKKITFALHDEDVERLHRSVAMTGISQAKLIACLLAASDEDITRLVRENLTKISEEKRAHRKEALEKRKAATEVVNALSTEQINAILNAVVKKGEQA